MNCSKCGKELEAKSLYCNICGTPVQLVPDFNPFDEAINAFLDESVKNLSHEIDDNFDNTDELKDQSSTNNVSIKGKNRQEGHSRFWVALVTLVLFISIGLIGAYTYSNSFSYVYKKAINEFDELNFTQSEIYFTRAHNMKPDNIECIRYLGMCSYELEQYNNAERFLLTAIESGDDSEDVYKYLTFTYVATNNSSAIHSLTENAPDGVKNLIESFNVKAPIFNEKTGVYADDLYITLKSETGNKILYTIDGTDPRKNGEEYRKSIFLSSGNHTIAACCVSDNGIYSKVVTNTYDISYGKPISAQIAPAGGFFTVPEPIVIDVPRDCTCYYTWDSTTPTIYSTEYTEPLEMQMGISTLTFILVDKHGMISDTFQYTYTCFPEEVMNMLNMGQ